MVLAWVCAAGLALAGCPQIDRVSPGLANAGAVIDLRDPAGKSLGFSGTVFFGEFPVPADQVLSWSQTDIFLRVPALESGSWPVRVVAGGVAGNVVDFELLPAPARLRVLCFGDSFTYRSYPGILQSLPWGDHEPTAVINQGKPGERLAFAGDRFADTVAYHHDGGDLDFIVLMEGTNDLSDTSGIGLTAMQASLDRMIGAVPPGVRVILATLLPRVDSCGDQESPATREWNEWLANFAASRGIPLVDTYGDFVSRVNWASVYYDEDDCLHPNQQGYERIAALFQAAILGFLP